MATDQVSGFADLQTAKQVEGVERLSFKGVAENNALIPHATEGTGISSGDVCTRYTGSPVVYQPGAGVANNMICLHDAPDDVRVGDQNPVLTSGSNRISENKYVLDGSGPCVV